MPEDEKGPWKEEVLEDLKVHIRTRQISIGAMDYEVRSVTIPLDEGTPPYEFQKKGSNYSPNPTTDVEEGEILVDGYIRFDGCSNNNFRSYVHACDRAEMVRFGKIFDRLFDLAGEYMPDHKDEFLK